MSCSNCLPSNPCNHHCNRNCGKVQRKSQCDNCPQVDWVPGTAATIGVTMDGCTDTLDLTSGIRNAESKTHFSQNPITGCLEYQNEQYVASSGTMGYIETVCPADIAKFINIDDLADVESKNPQNCDMLVFNPECGNDPCPDPCGNPYQWKPYTIPDAEDCQIEPDENGNYKVLTKNDCGCIVECGLPIVPANAAMIDYHRDSVPDDPDFPWYYGCYNDKINLYLSQNAPDLFGKFDLEVTVNYGVQCIHSKYCRNVNWVSIVVPAVEGEPINIEREASILQDDCTTRLPELATPVPETTIPWGTKSMRSSFTFIVPKGKEAYLHHEFRLRTLGSYPGYYLSDEYDGKIVPDSIASQVNEVPYNASRLNALQVIIRPTRSSSNFNPVKDQYRDQLDPPTDVYQGMH